MTPKELRNERLAERMIKNLKRRNMEAFYCKTSEETIQKVLELIPDGSSITWGGSMTIRDMGIPDALRKKGTYEVLDRDLVEGNEEKVQMYVRAFTTDVYLSSANAISEDGVIVNIDGNGNRVAAITWGPKKVIFIIGLNKVAQTVEAALARARSTASAQRERVVNNLWNMETPERLRVGEQGSGMEVKNKEVKSEEPKVEDDTSVEDEPAKEPLFIIRFKDVVEARLSDSDLSVDDLAAAMNLSRVQLYRKVKAISGSSPVELLRTARLNRGYQMLIKGDKTVSEVAYDVGFTAPSYFTKCFKDEFGISPSDLS